MFIGLQQGGWRLLASLKSRPKFNPRFGSQDMVRSLKIIDPEANQIIGVLNLQGYVKPALDLRDHPKPANEGHLKTGQR
jgi:hypothetical protein